jgi:hypothetical protein
VVVANQFLELFAFHGMPFSDENCAIVINVNFGMPRQAIVTGVDLVRFAVVVKCC